MRILFSILFVLSLACKPRYEKLPVCDVQPDLSDELGAYGITFYEDIDKAKQCAATTGRKMLIMFTGYAHMAVTGMDWEILREPEVRELINDRFVLVVLYVDDKTEIPLLDSSICVEYGCETPWTVGKRNSLLEAENFQQNSQPMYVVADSSLQPIVTPMGYTNDADEFLEMLEASLNLK